MQKPSLGWQSWSPPFPSWHGFPRWDYNPLSDSIAPNPAQPVKLQKSAISLWCTWHQNGLNIDENLVLTQAQKLTYHSYVPQYILIDDGWCGWGDWTTPQHSKFPHGIPFLSKELSQLGYQTGLWISPFLVDPGSNLAKLHLDWIVKNKNGKPFNGFVSYPLLQNFNPKYLLDATNPAVMTYLQDSLDTIIRSWGITLLKLDHLYAPYFAPIPSIAKSAPHILESLFTYLQKNHPRVYTIACGCPFDVAQNRVDSIRLSKDINSPRLRSIPLLNHLFYLKRKKLLNQKLATAKALPTLPFGLDPDVAINQQDAQKYYALWRSGIIRVFGLGYNL